jgi:hypothetical protein
MFTVVDGRIAYDAHGDEAVRIHTVDDRQFVGDRGHGKIVISWADSK